MATLVGEDGVGGFERAPRRTRDLEERLKQALERIWDLEDELRALRSRVDDVELAAQRRAVA